MGQWLKHEKALPQDTRRLLQRSVLYVCSEQKRQVSSQNDAEAICTRMRVISNLDRAL